MNIVSCYEELAVKLNSEQIKAVEQADGEFIKSDAFREKINDEVSLIVFYENIEDFESKQNYSEHGHQFLTYDEIVSKTEGDKILTDAYENHLVVFDDFGRAVSFYFPKQLLKEYLERETEK